MPDPARINLAGMAVLVTGANRGLGAGFVRAALDRGATKVYAAVRDPDSVDPCVVADDRVMPVRLDLADPASISAAGRTCPDVDLLVSNAGAASAGPCIGPGAADVLTLFRTNVFAQLDLVEVFRPSLAARRGGFVLVASVSALILSRSSPAYSASKAAGMMLVQGLRTQLADEGISVSIVFPGFVDTDGTTAMQVPKATPLLVAGRSLDGWGAGRLSIFPDRYAEMLGEHLGPGMEQVLEDPHATATSLVEHFCADPRAGL